MTIAARAQTTVGRNGRGIITLEAAPSATDGRIGEWARARIDDVLFEWGPKTEDGWGDPTQIAGASFIQKTSALSDANDGIDGDYGLTVINGALRTYGPKAAGAWGAATSTISLTMSASFTIGTESADAITVSIQLKDAAGADLAVRGSVFAYLSDDANGDSITGTAPSGGVAVGTDGLAIPVVAGKAWQLVSEADGDIDLVITEAGADTWRLVLVVPDGRLAVSGAITFAA